MVSGISTASKDVPEGSLLISLLLSHEEGLLCVCVYDWGAGKGHALVWVQIYLPVMLQSVKGQKDVKWKSDRQRD